jgi:copper transporter 1
LAAGTQLTGHDRLLFMTYNGMIMLAVAVGAFVGYLAFADGTPATKSVACH